MPRHIAAAAALCAAFLATAGASSTTAYVSPSGSDTAAGTKDDPFRTVSHGVSVVGENGTVYAFPGVYTSLPLVKEEGVSILAFPEGDAASAQTHVFSGVNKYPSANINVNANRTLIRGFGIRQTRGYASVFGAVYVSFGGVRLEDCEFSDNAVGVSVLHATVELQDCRFSLPTTTTAPSSASRRARRDPDDGVDAKDVATTGSTGVGVLFSYQDFGGGGSAKVSNCSFTGPGGTAFKVSDGVSELEVEDSRFEGVAIGVSTSNLGRSFRASVRTSHFHNVSQAFYLYGMSSPAKGSLDIDACVFEDGGTDTTNGGVVTAGADVSVTVENSTFSGHHGEQGSVLYCGEQASMSVLGSRFQGNVAADGSPGWCSKNCGFVASGNTVSGNTQGKDTGPCPGLPPSSGGGGARNNNNNNSDGNYLFHHERLEVDRK